MCLICRSGYNHDGNGGCNLNPITSNINTEENPDLEYVTISQIFVISFLSIFI